MNKFMKIAAISLLLIVARQAKADIIYSNLGPSNSFDPIDGYYVNGSNFNNQVIAQQFTPGVTSTFQDAIVALSDFAGSGSQVVVSLETDAGGQPGVILEQLTVGGFSAYPGGSLVTATSNLHPTLLAGTNYWLVLSASSPTDDGVWMFNTIGDTSTGGNFLFNQSGSTTGPWNPDNGTTRSAFEIDGNPTGASAVPEPATLALLGLGIFGLAGYGWRQRKMAVAMA